MTKGATVVFSTGATIPTERIRGVAFDWAAERPAALAFIEAITPDSIRYLAQTDSAGAFTIGPLPSGNYLVRAIIDQNNNRALDRLELFDTLRVTVPQPTPIELLMAARDTLPAKLLSVSLKDSLTLTATFDRALEPTQTISASEFRLVGPDSTEIPLRSVQSPTEERKADSVAAAAKTDSTRRADSLAGKAPVSAPVAPAPLATARPTGGRATAPIPKPSLPPPFAAVSVRLNAPLTPNTSYRLTATGLRGLSRLTETVTRSFTTPKPLPRDTTRARADSGRGAPPPARTPPR